MPELTPGKAWTERTSGNMEKRREGCEAEGYRMHTQTGGQPGRQQRSGQNGYWFCSQLAHDFPLLLTTVVPYFTKHYIDLAMSEKDTFAFVQ